MKKKMIRTLLAVTALAFFFTAPALAADVDVVSNLKSTSHTLGTVDANSKTMTISMAWNAATTTKSATLAGYNYSFSTSTNTTLLNQKFYPSTSPGTSFAVSGSNDSVAYYFHIKAVFTATSSFSADGKTYERGEDYWGPQVTQGPYYIDNVAPANPSVSINSGASSTSSINVTLTLGATNAAQMNISNTSYGAGTWVAYATSKQHTLTTGNGTKTVYVQYKDNAGNISQANDTIELLADALSVSASQSVVTKGTTMTLTASGGTTPYTAWTIVEEAYEDGTWVAEGDKGAIATVAASGNTQGILTPVGAGTCKVEVTDSAQTKATTSVIIITVLEINPPTVSVAKGQIYKDLSADYGTPPFTWSTSPGTAGSIDSSGIFTASATQTGTEIVTVRDTNNITATATVNVTSASISINSGNQQSVAVGMAAASNLAVKVADTQNQGLANYVVDFSITSQPSGATVGGSFSTAAPAAGQEVTTYRVLTGADGIASVPFFVGTKSGSYSISAACTKIDPNTDGDGNPNTGSLTDTSVTNSPRNFSLTAISGSAAIISYVSGNNQSGSPGVQLTNPFVVQVTDAYQNPKSNVTVTFAVTQGTGTLTGGVNTKDVVTGSDGKASVLLTPGTGTITIEASANLANGSPVVFTASAGFNLNHSYRTGLNLVPFTLQGTGIGMTSELDAAIVNANPGVSVSQIFGWDAQNQRFTSPYINLGGGFVMGDLDLSPGQCYFVQVSGTAALQMSGTDYSSLLLYNGLNLIAVPLGISSTVDDAPKFDQHIATDTALSVSQIFGWDADNQRFSSPYINLGGGFVMGEFVLSAEDHGYFVQVSGTGTYTP